MGGRVEPPRLFGQACVPEQIGATAAALQERLLAEQGAQLAEYEQRLTRLHDGLERVLLLAESSRFLDGVGYGGRDGRDAHDQINLIVAELNRVV